MSDPVSETNPGDQKLPDISGAGGAGSTDAKPAGEKAGKASNVIKPVRRPVPGSGVRRSAPDAAPASKAPAPPDTAKTVAFAVCGLLVVGIVGMGGYLLLRNKPVAVVKAPMDNLAGDARALAEKAVNAEALYKVGKEKAASGTLDDLRDADKKLTEANVLFNEIVDSNQTVDGYKEKIDFARDMKASIDKELLPIRNTIFKLEGEVRRNKAKSGDVAKTPDGTTPPAPVPPPATTPQGKEPAESELTDANLDRLFKDDPSEYERLAKVRKAKDPAYVIKKE